jgi:hypothetical protein
LLRAKKELTVNFEQGGLLFQKQIRNTVLSAFGTGVLCGFLSLADSHRRRRRPALGDGYDPATPKRATWQEAVEDEDKIE